MYSISASLNMGSGTAYTTGLTTVVYVPSSRDVPVNDVICFYPNELTGHGQILYRVVTSKPSSTTLIVDYPINLPIGYSFHWAYAQAFPFTVTSGVGGANEVKYKIQSKTSMMANPMHGTFDGRPMDYEDNPTQTITVKGNYVGTSDQLSNFILATASMIDGLQYTRSAYLFTSDVPYVGKFVYMDSIEIGLRSELRSGAPLGIADISLSMYERRLPPY